MKHLALVVSLCAVSACGDPLANLTKISEVDLAETDPVANALPSEAEVTREGFFGTDAAKPAADLVALEAIPEGADPAPQGGGFLERLRRRAAAAQADAAQREAVTAAVTEAGTGTDALLELEDEPATLAALELVTPSPRRGLFGLRIAPDALTSTQSDDVVDVAYGTTLPYGEIARSCEARRKPLGRKIESASAKGFKLYDSDPGTLGPRTYYITGFADDCPRQLTAANVILGAPSRYEELHYGPTGRDLPYGATDTAYDKIKRDVCGVRKGKPCGRDIAKMDKTTFFVSSYPRFDSSAQWAEVLIHDGIVMATALKSYK